jgi:hypothetical protein
MMLSPAGWMTVLALLTATEPPIPSYLLATHVEANGQITRAIEPYCPHEGDIVLFDDHNKFWFYMYKLVGSGMPDHSGIVVNLPDGRPAILESGPDDGKLIGLRVGLLDPVPRLEEFLLQYHGTIYVRRLKAPLSQEQSNRLTDFALAQDGKRYALGRLLLQATPCRCRSGLRAKYFASTYMDRSGWLCSELVVAAGTAAGLFDPRIHHANRIYPLDMFDDKTYDLSGTWFPPAVWSPTPDAWEFAK